ncbi:type III pantothenate kinase [Microbulbifer sp. 2205BS26-8]|uniref:type III pantothenate kinase n=1 Tax=Microbulbifer sp. 2205BS26-8 TaxID=3064386 RepID=UPI00273FDDCE|nr:type III pantothenate kinase [Microbulbifer sp. 2205BS26-8]MDP5208383.1 type III pantothenate kinase [Microbulbifer sp. 2205BS26-8]
MILELDIGNSRGKWRLLAGEKVGLRGGFDVAALAAGRLPGDWGELRPTRVRAVNVAGPVVAELLVNHVWNLFSLEVEFSQVESECAGVVCGYDNHSLLGADRWLAMLAAYGQSRRAALIVDCGSAVTLDLLDNDGRHLGGYIAPGIGLMQRSLRVDTHAARSARDIALNDPLCAGRTTDEGVNRGLLLMVLGAIDRALEELQHSAGRESLLWLTGGDAPLLSTFCRREHRLVPDLVLDGLSLSNP